MTSKCQRTCSRINLIEMLQAQFGLTVAPDRVRARSLGCYAAMFNDRLAHTRLYLASFVYRMGLASRNRKARTYA